jgi:hypothetical protein
VRAKVEHTIGVIKRVFGFQKVRYRGLATNLCTVLKSRLNRPTSTRCGDGCCMRRRRVDGEWEIARFVTTNTESAIETPSQVALHTKSLPMTAFMASYSAFP